MKQFSITVGIIKRPVTVFMLTLMVIGFGLFALSRLKVTLYPPFNIPVLAISSGYRNVSPEDIQRIIVEPIEAAVSATEGIESLESTSRKGSSFVILRLKPGTDIRKTELKVRESIDRIRSQIPREANDPVIFQFDPENRPIMRLSVQASNRGLDELRKLSVEFIEPRFERLNGVAAADTRGGLERTIYVNVDQEKLALYKLLPSHVETAIRSNNVQIPVGNVAGKDQSLGVRAISMYTDVEQIKQTIVSISADGIPVRVRDLAEVDDGFAQITTLVEVNGKNTVTVDIQKQSDANTLDVTQAVEAAVPDIIAQLPDGIEITVLRNSGGFIETSVQNLANSAVQALVVVVIILVLFMGGWRIALIVATSIPISMTATFAVMYFAGLTLNIFSITGLALAIGMLVDNSIVVSESIASKLEEGMNRMQAAIQGTNEVIGALVGATLTTLGVFVPMLGLTGFTGVVAKDLALTICIAILISFIASIVLIPVLASLFMNVTAFESRGKVFKAMHKMERGYGNALNWLLFHKRYVVLGGLVIVASSFFLFRAIPGGFFPEGDSGELDIDVTLPTGTKLATTASVIREFSQIVMKNPDVKNVVTSIGQRRWSQETNRGEIAVTLVDKDKRKKSSQEYAMMYRKMLEKPGVDINVDVEGGSGIRMGNWGGGGGVRVSLFGSDIQVLQALSDKIEAIAMQDSNVINVTNPRIDPTPELHFIADRQRLSRMGASLTDVANALKTQTRGTQVGEFRADGREIPIEVRTSETAIKSRDDLDRLAVYQTNGVRVPIAAVGDFEPFQGLDRITRRDRETLMDVSIQVKGNPIEYNKKVADMMATQIPIPDGYRYEMTGSSRDAQQSGSELFLALLTALALTYMIMASQFENFIDPLVVMFTIPLAFFGSLVLLFITGTALSIPASIGIVLLIGIVVNNGIVLIDYIHQYTSFSKDDDPEDFFKRFVLAAQRRMRPILLTALTTIFSMVPLALEMGSGSETWSPLARSVIGGLTFSSILSLFMVPVLTMLASKKGRAVIRVLKMQKLLAQSVTAESGNQE
ncbi:efflux RND transporter permease subunit [bacterium]|nr:MAG: efflux RND transporter permease subunit [bacterium]